MEAREEVRAKGFLEPHLSFTAERADPGIYASDPGEEVLPGFPRFFCVFMRTVNTEQFPAPREMRLSVSVAQDPIVPDLHEAIWEDVEEKPADELGSLQAHHLEGVTVMAIPVSEGDLALLQLDQPVV